MSLIREYLNELGKESRKLRFTLIAQLLPFLLLTIGWLLFPFLEKWNLGFQTFYSTCGLAFLIACSGICFWLIERFTKGRKPSWPGYFLD